MTANHTNKKKIHFPKFLCVEFSALIGHISWVIITDLFLRQGYVMERLKSSLRKFYGRYGDLIKHYEVSLSPMLHGILGHDHIQ